MELIFVGYSRKVYIHTVHYIQTLYEVWCYYHLFYNNYRSYMYNSVVGMTHEGEGKNGVRVTV